jgi:hypothetical protein
VTAREICPEVDRVVWSVGRAAPERHRDRVRGAAADIGLDNLRLIPPMADFFLHGGIDREVAKLRYLYFDPAEADGVFDGLIDAGLLVEDPLLRATERFEPLLEVITTTRAETANSAWVDEQEAVTTALDFANVVAAALDERHVVADRHRRLPLPEGSAAALEQRLVTLRYVRQHDHAEAWRERELTPAEMVVLTGLWSESGAIPDTHTAAARHLAERGWVDLDEASLTPLGTSEREAIERATNERTDAVYSVLGPDTRTFFDALQTIPDADIVLG